MCDGVIYMDGAEHDVICIYWLQLMGLEECEENDEACLKRRMVAEAHLDYIYTQKNKPKP